jgi:ABC-type proline/glycine betaine transport system permease subunit
LIGGFGYWELAMKTLALVTGSVIVSLLIRHTPGHIDG